jgi:hypothetical protein
LQIVSEEIRVWAKPPEGVTGGLPACGVSVDRKGLLEVAQDEVAAVTPSRGAHLPVTGGQSSLEVSGRGAELRCVKDGLESAKFIE